VRHIDGERHLLRVEQGKGGKDRQVVLPETLLQQLRQYWRQTHPTLWLFPRILGMEDGQVLFHYKDYRDRDTPKVMRLSGIEFIRRFLLHVLPKGLMRLRHYGFLANRCRAEKLRCIRSALAQDSESTPAEEDTTGTVCDGYPCPKCHQGTVRAVYPLAPVRWAGG